jgi:phage replication-related protein YjqB (UPF0714/DUF867 family)
VVDRYPNFATLAAAERHEIDYGIWLRNRGTPIVVLAPHGGWIEPGTSEIARAIAREDFSIYAFEGLRPGRPHGDLHITSTRFDEPDALQLVGDAEIVIAIHGRADGDDPTTVWLGGRGTTLGNAIASSLRAAGFEAATAKQELAGREPTNLCNRGSAGAGVQLELPRTLRNKLVDEPASLRSFSGAVREATLD